MSNIKHKLSKELRKKHLNYHLLFDVYISHIKSSNCIGFGCKICLSTQLELIKLKKQISIIESSL